MGYGRKIGLASFESELLLSMVDVTRTGDDSLGRFTRPQAAAETCVSRTHPCLTVEETFLSSATCTACVQ